MRTKPWRWVLAIAVLALSMAAVVWLRQWLEPSLSRQQIRTALVEVGPVERTVTAAGIVVNAGGQIVVSPAESRILKLLQRPGTLVEKGDLIMVLDMGAADLGADHLAEKLEQNRIDQYQLDLDLETRLGELATEKEIHRLEAVNLHAKVVQGRNLLELGAVSQVYVRQAEEAEERAEAKRLQIEASRRAVTEAAQSRMQSLALAHKVLERELTEAQRRSDRAEIRADLDGVLTWILEEQGAAVYPGEILARIADRSSFRVDATLPAVHAYLVEYGQRAHVRLEDGELLRGEVTHLSAGVDGAIALEISLTEGSDPRLRSDMRVKVYVVVARIDAALRLPRGPAIAADVRDVFVLLGEVAVRRSVQIGLANFDYCQVLEGLVEGEEVVISDMAEYLTWPVVALRP